MNNFTKLCFLLCLVGLVVILGIAIFKENSPNGVNLEKELMLNDLEKVVVFFHDYVHDGKKHLGKQHVSFKKGTKDFNNFVRLLASQTIDVKEQHAVQVYGPMTHQIGLYYKDWLRVTIWYSSIRDKIFVYDDSADYISGKIDMPFSTRSYVISADNEFIQMIESL